MGCFARNTPISSLEPQNDYFRRATARIATSAGVIPEILDAYRQEGHLEFGPGYIIPKPFDPRLMDFVPPAVAQAAVDSGVARVEFPQHYGTAPKR